MIQNLIDSTTLVSEIYLGWLWQTMARKRLNSNTSILSLLWLHKSFHTDKHSYIRAVIWCTHSSQDSVWKDSHQLQMLYLFNMLWQWLEKVLLRRCPVYTAFMWGRGEFSLQYENSFTWVMSKHWSLVHRFKNYISMWRKHLSLWFPGGFKIFPFYRYAGLSWWNMNISPSFFPPSASVPSQIPSHCTLEMVRCRRDCCSGSLYNCEDSWECTLHQYSTTHGGRTVLA